MQFSEMSRQAIILAGGKGTRLRTVVSDLPKPMAPVNGRPFLEFILDDLVEYGFDSVVLAVGYKYEIIQDHFGQAYRGMNIYYSIENKPLGTGGAIKLAFDKITSDVALVINGDTYFKYNPLPLYEFRKYLREMPIVALKHLMDFDRYGAVELDSNFKIKEFREKSYRKEGYINAGVYLIDYTVFKDISDDVFSFEKEILESKSIPWHGFPQSGYFKDIGIPTDYQQFQLDDISEAFSKTKQIDKSWTLFLDRDGVINKRKVGGYIQTVDEFEFLPGAKEAISEFSKIFGRIIIVTNQQGIGKGLFHENDLQQIHTYMVEQIRQSSGRIDAIHYCPELAVDDPKCRKPNTGMAIEAKKQFPEIDFAKSIMIGDSPSDMEFGKRIGMKCVGVGDRVTNCDVQVGSLGLWKINLI